MPDMESDTATETDEPSTGQDADATGDTESAAEPGGFAATIEAGTLQTFLSHPAALVDECKLQVSASGLEITAVDPANVGMVNAHLGAGAFDSFAGADLTLGIPLARLCESVGMAASTAEMTIEYDPERRVLSIASDGLTFTLALIDPDSIRAEPDIPDLDDELRATVSFPADHLTRAITAAGMVGNTMSVETERTTAGDDDGTLFFRAEGDTDDVEVAVGPDEWRSATIPTDPCRSLLSLEYLDDISKPIATGADLSLRVGTEFPVKLSHSLSDGAGAVTYLLAPRIESDAATGGA